MKLADPKLLTPEILQVFPGGVLLTAGDRASCNTMTIGWAQLGTMWSVPVCSVYVRPERYTYSFMEENDYFTVSVLPSEMKKTLAFCGTKSGRDVDKIKECGLTVAYGAGDAPYFEESEWVVVCKKLYAADMGPDAVIDEATVLPYYGERGNWHRMYMGQVVEVYTK